jgi:hypothetical protein
MLLSLCEKFNRVCRRRGYYMVKTDYKYNPNNFTQVLGLSGELTAFYKLHENYSKERNWDNRFALKKHWEDLFFTIKHREIEGSLSPVIADEIRGYLEELAND